MRRRSPSGSSDNVVTGQIGWAWLLDLNDEGTSQTRGSGEPDEEIDGASYELAGGATRFLSVI